MKDRIQKKTPVKHSKFELCKDNCFECPYDDCKKPDNKCLSTIRKAQENIEIQRKMAHRNNYGEELLIDWDKTRVQILALLQERKISI